MGKPRNGDAFTLMKLCRIRFKYALRKCKRDKETIVSDRIAEKMCQTDQRNFCKEIRCTMNSYNVKLPTCIDGVHGDCNIAAMWKHHYSTIYLTVFRTVVALKLMMSIILTLYLTMKLMSMLTK